MKDQEVSGIPWTEDAQALLKKVPFFIRKNVEKEAEDYARSHGMSRVEASVIVRIKASKSGDSPEASAPAEVPAPPPPVAPSENLSGRDGIQAEAPRVSESPAPRPSATPLREYASFIILRIDPEWRKVHPAEVGHGKKEFGDVVRSFESQVASSSYSLVGLSGLGDVILWRVGTNIGLLQEMTGKLLSTYLGRYLTVEKSYLGFLGENGSRAPFVPRNSRFIHVRPLVRSKDWPQLPEFVREGAERERRAVVDRFQGVRMTLASSYGLDESDLLMIMESDSAELIVDLNQALQTTQENRYLNMTCRGLTGISRPLGDVLDMLGGV
ncbi:MAG: chlorite dismutase family protein [Nitrospiraceae bacterium]|nr:chlorite dismutase family protein [Nitrospiraceae bacterium]